MPPSRLQAFRLTRCPSVRLTRRRTCLFLYRQEESVGIDAVPKSQVNVQSLYGHLKTTLGRDRLNYPRALPYRASWTGQNTGVVGFWSSGLVCLG